jgi:WD40 repeat protein
MPWVEGFPLNEFVSDNLGRLNVLESLLTVWGRMCRRLRESGLAHADLQHGNVILVPGGQKSLLSVRLVDYDGMFVPALAGRPPSEYGHPSYQHPDRVAKQVYSADLDRFPHLVVSTALRGLVVGGKGLWAKYDTGDNVLFREADYKNPAGSELMRELWDTRDPSLVALLSHLVIACTRPIEQSPWLDLVMPEGKSPTVSPSQEREAAAILGAPVSFSVATPGASGTHRVPSGAMAVPAARVAAPVASPVPARAIPVGPTGSEPQLAFGSELKAGSRGGKRGKSLAGALVLAGVVLLAAGAGAAYHFKLIPGFAPQAVAPPPTDPTPPPPPPTDPGPPKPPDVPVVAPAPTPEVTARRVWAVAPEEFVKPVEPRNARFTADGKGVVVAGTGVPGLCLVLSAVDGRTATKFPGHETACVASPGPEGKAFSLGLGESKFLVWSTADGKPTAPVPLPEKTAGDYKRFTLTADVGRALLEGSRQARVVDLVDGKDVTPLPNATPGQVALDRDYGRVLSLIPRDKQLVLWAPDGSEERKIPLTNPASTIEAWSPDAGLVALLNFAAGTPPRQTLTLADAATGQPVKTLDSGYVPGTTKFSADGSHLVTLTKSGTVELWRVKGWALVTTVPSTVAAPPTAVDLSPNGMKLVLTGPGNAVRLYDVGGTDVAFDPGKAKKGTVAERWRTEAADPKTQVLKFPAVSPDGKTLFALVAPNPAQADPGATPVLKAYDAVFGEEKFAAKLGKPGPLPFAVTPTASGRVAVQYPSPLVGPTPILVLDGKTGEPARPTTAIERKVLDQPRAVDPDAKLFAAVTDGDSPTVGVWNLETGSQVATIAKGKQAPRFLGFASGDAGPALVAAYPDRILRFTGPAFDQTATVTDKISLKTGLGLGLTADGSRLLVAAQTAVAAPVFTFSTIDVKTAAQRDVLRDRKVADVQLLGGDRLFVADEGGVTLTEIATGKPVSATALPGKPTRVASSLDATVLAAVEGSVLVAYRGYLDAPPPSLPKTEGRFGVVWAKPAADLGRTPFRAVSVGAGGRVLAATGPRLLAFDPAGTLVALRPGAPVEFMTATPDGSLYTAERGTDDGTPRFRRTDAKTGKPVTEPFEVPRAPASAFGYDVSPDGRTALAFSGATLTVWAVPSARRLWVKEPEDDVRFLSAAFLDSAKILVAARGERNELLVFDIDSQKLDRSIPLPDRAAGPIADVDPVGGQVLIAYPEGENGGSVFDLKSGKLQYTLGKVSGEVPPRFAAGGRLIVAAAADKLVVFNARTGKELARDALPAPIQEFAASPDGSHVAAVFGPEDAPRSELALLKLSDTGPDDPKLVERTALPDEATLAAALAAVKEANKAKYAVTTPLGKKALLDTLIRAAPAAEPVPRFAMLKESLRLAADLRDFAQMDAVGEQLGKGFAVDEFDLKAEALARIADSFTVVAPAKAFADACTEQAERAADRSNYDAAMKLVGLAAKAYRAVALTKSAGAADAHVGYLKRAKARAAAAKDALEILRVNPDDPDANLTVGAYRCVYLGRWEDGLKHLEKGSDVALRSAAAKDLAAAADSELDIGDAWTAAAAAAAGSQDDRSAYVTRARYWYTKAAAGPPMVAAKADARLAVKHGPLDLKPGLIQEGFGTNAKGVKTTGIKVSLAPVLDLNGADLDFDRGNGASVRWSGFLYPPRPGRYKLILTSTDPAQMKLEGTLLIDLRDANERETARSAVVLLSDKPVPIEIGWTSGSVRRQRIRLTWVPLGGAEELVPVEHLLHDKKADALISK